MLDSMIRPYITPSLDKLAEKVDSYHIPANLITLAGLGIGLVGCFFIAVQSYFFGLILILLGRLFDGLDGAVARRKGPTDFGAYLDIVCDFIFYAAFVFFFVMALPNHYLAGLFLLFSYIGTAASFLAYAIIAEKRGLSTEANGPKSFFHATGLAEGTETIAFMALACLFPVYFSVFAFLFGILCWITTVGRIMQAWRTFSPIEQNYDEAESIH